MTAPQPNAAPLDTTVAVETPEHVRFRHQVVGPLRRGVAWGIDVVIRGLIVGLCLAVVSAFTVVDESFAGVSAGLGAVLFFAAEWFYFATFEALWSGRTPGKRFVGLRVVLIDGQPIDATAAILRNLLRAADFLPLMYGLGSIVMTRDNRFRRFGDLAAGTMVINESRRRPAIPYQLTPPPSTDELAWIRSLPPLPADDLKTIDLLLRRSSRLHPARVQELAQILAPVYGERLGAKYHEPVRFLALLHGRARMRGLR